MCLHRSWSRADSQRRWNMQNNARKKENLETGKNMPRKRKKFLSNTPNVKNLLIKTNKRNKSGKDLPTVKSTKWCDKCQKGVPERSHHCILCERCIYKRDHHCFLMGVCIGYSNQKYFIFFSFIHGYRNTLWFTNDCSVHEFAIWYNILWTTNIRSNFLRDYLLIVSR